MSDSPLQPLGQELLSQWSENLIQNYVLISTSTLMIFDWIITLGLEIKTIWTGRLTVTKALFVTSRYSYILYLICQIMFFFLRAQNLDLGCNVFVRLSDAAFIFTTIANIGIFALRTYAIYDRDWRILVVAGIPGAALLASMVWQLIVTFADPYPAQYAVGLYICTSDQPNRIPLLVYTDPLFIIFTYIVNSHSQLLNIISNIVFDAVIIGLTVYRTYGLAKLVQKSNIKGGLSIVLLRDGIWYYSIIFLPMFVQTVLYGITVHTNNATISFAAGDFNNIVATLKVLMINRLVLNLSQIVNQKGDLISTTKGYNNMSFAINADLNRKLGNIGAPLRTHNHDYDYEEGELDVNIAETLNNRDQDTEAELKMWDRGFDIKEAVAEGDVERSGSSRESRF